MIFIEILRILNFSMNDLTFIKSFSKGQITIPKILREKFGLGDKFWLKLYIQQDKIILEPIEKKVTNNNYIKKLANIKNTWVLDKEYRNIREELKKRDKNIKI